MIRCWYVKTLNIYLRPDIITQLPIASKNEFGKQDLS